MSNRFTRCVEVGANVGIVAVCTIILFQMFVPRSLDADRNPAPRVDFRVESFLGKKIEVPGVNWQSHRATLVLGFRKECGFCLESVPFYERLTRTAAATGIQIVALVPEPIHNAAEFLRSEGVRVDVIRPMRTASPPITRTPTLLLISAEGLVLKVWPGKLPTWQETMVLEALREAK